MVREVTLRFNGHEKTYPIESDTHYAARMEALKQFLEEFRIPGRPVEYLTTKKGMIEIEVRSAVDRRTLPKDGPSTQFYTEQASKLRKWIREGDFTDQVKTRATELLLELEGMLGG